MVTFVWGIVVDAMIPNDDDDVVNVINAAVGPRDHVEGPKYYYQYSHVKSLAAAAVAPQP